MGVGARRISRGTGARPGRGILDAALALRQLLNPVRRSSLTGLARRHLTVAAVWPDGPGFAARLESPRRPGIPVVWVRWRDGYEIWPFPEDPELPALAELMDRGYSLLGHRLGHRATVLSPAGEVFYLRSPRVAANTFSRLRKLHRALEGAGIGVARLGEADRELNALRAELVRREATVDGGGDWTVVGGQLARVHGVAAPPGLPERGPGAALDAAVRQLGMAVHSGHSFTLWLERRLERWRLLGASNHAPGRALVHGELHPEQIAWTPAPVFLDWEVAGAGDPEEDLGDLAASFYRAAPREACPTFAALKRSYLAAGGRLNQAVFEHYARLSLVRLLAIQVLREPEHARLHGQQAAWAAWPEVVSAW